MNYHLTEADICFKRYLLQIIIYAKYSLMQGNDDESLNIDQDEFDTFLKLLPHSYYYPFKHLMELIFVVSYFILKYEICM